MNNERPQIIISFNQEQIDEISRLSNISIEGARDLKEALQKLIPSLPSGNRAGRPKKTP